MHLHELISVQIASGFCILPGIGGEFRSVKWKVRWGTHVVEKNMSMK